MVDPAMPNEGDPKRMSSRAELVRGDWRRRRTQAASSSEVFPWALLPVKMVMPLVSGHCSEA